MRDSFPLRLLNRQPVVCPFRTPFATFGWPIIKELGIKAE